ncbi:MAG: succinate dehydrogenase, hydrophobic membrane anchor protein [Sphingomonadaceae bacterium]
MGNGTSIGRVRALGSAHSGAHHWLMVRYTSFANLLSGLYVAFGLAGLGSYTFKAMHDWLAHPLPATMMGLFVLCTFWHAALGLRELIEDYVHDHANKAIALVALNLLSFAGAAFGLLCVLRIALGAA